MKKFSVQAWMSLDGVFDAETMGDWWNQFDGPERRAHILAGIASADALVLGRRTYEMLAPYWSSFKDDADERAPLAAKLNSAPKYVVSSTLKSADWNNTTIIRAGAAEALSHLKRDQQLRLIGSATLVHSLSAQRIIDEYDFLVTPVIMGRGRRFFDGGKNTVRLQLRESRALSQGVIALCYEPSNT